MKKKYLETLSLFQLKKENKQLHQVEQSHKTLNHFLIGICLLLIVGVAGLSILHEKTSSKLDYYENPKDGVFTILDKQYYELSQDYATAKKELENPKIEIKEVEKEVIKEHCLIEDCMLLQQGSSERTKCFDDFFKQYQPTETKVVDVCTNCGTGVVSNHEYTAKRFDKQLSADDKTDLPWIIR